MALRAKKETGIFEWHNPQTRSFFPTALSMGEMQRDGAFIDPPLLLFNPCQQHHLLRHSERDPGVKSLSGNSMVQLWFKWYLGVYLLSVVHKSLSAFEAYPVFSLSVAAPGKEVSLGKVLSSS